jgi:hypothetical protein
LSTSVQKWRHSFLAKYDIYNVATGYESNDLHSTLILPNFYEV